MVLKVLKQSIVDDDLCRRGCPLNSQTIGYGFDSPPSRLLYPDAIVRKSSADRSIHATLRHFDANCFVATIKTCQDMTTQSSC